MIKKYCFLLLIIGSIANAQVKILFDATKTEMASNADWVIDADLHNLNTYIPVSITGGTESNPQRIPSPAQSTIISSTPETYWDGALSHWAIDCVRQGYTVETLPWNGRITYGDATNVQDLSNYKVFVVDEPNNQFLLTSEKNAIVNFVKNGGGLMMIADHTISDRNNDNWDSLMVWNDLMATNTVQVNPFGITFDAVGISQSPTNFANLTTSNPSANQIIKGPASPITCSVCGVVTKIQWSNGTTMTLSAPTSTTRATGLVYTTGSATTGTTNVMCAASTFYAGRVVAIGDSSIADDGTGDPNDTSIIDGYITDAGGTGNHQKLLMNAIVWLVENPLKTNEFENTLSSLRIAPNPIANKELKLYFNNSFYLDSDFTIYDATGRLVKQFHLSNANFQDGFQTMDCQELQSGLYFGKFQIGVVSKTITFSILN